MKTTFSNKCFILGSFFIQEVDNEEFANFFEYHNLGLPLAYAVSQDFCNITDKGMKWIENTWEEFLEALSIEDSGFRNLEEISAKQEEQ